MSKIKYYDQIHIDGYKDLDHVVTEMRDEGNNSRVVEFIKSEWDSFIGEEERSPVYITTICGRYKVVLIDKRSK